MAGPLFYINNNDYKCTHRTVEIINYIDVCIFYKLIVTCNAIICLNNDSTRWQTQPNWMSFVSRIQAILCISAWHNTHSFSLHSFLSLLTAIITNNHRIVVDHHRPTLNSNCTHGHTPGHVQSKDVRFFFLLPVFFFVFCLIKTHGTY